MDFNIELQRHLQYGHPMPIFYHLVYYNFKGSTPYDYQNALLSNYKIFQPIYKKLKKLRNRNPFPFELNIPFINRVILEIESKNINRLDYSFRRKEFKYLRDKIFIKLLEKNNNCKYCGIDTDLSVDHIIALFNGGTNSFSNMQILCRSCNSKKGSKLNYIYNG